MGQSMVRWVVCAALAMCGAIAVSISPAEELMLGDGCGEAHHIKDCPHISDGTLAAFEKGLDRAIKGNKEHAKLRAKLDELRAMEQKVGAKANDDHSGEARKLKEEVKRKLELS